MNMLNTRKQQTSSSNGQQKAPFLVETYSSLLQGEKFGFRSPDVPQLHCGAWQGSDHCLLPAPRDFIVTIVLQAQNLSRFLWGIISLWFWNPHHRLANHLKQHFTKPQPAAWRRYSSSITFPPVSPRIQGCLITRKWSPWILKWPSWKSNPSQN